MQPESVERVAPCMPPRNDSGRRKMAVTCVVHAWFGVYAGKVATDVGAQTSFVRPEQQKSDAKRFAKRMNWGPSVR